MIVFQALLLVLLALPLFSAALPPLFLAAAFAVLLVGAAFRALSLDESQRPAAWLLLAFFAVMSLGMTGALMLGVSVFWIGGASALALGVFFAILAWRFSAIECALLGWTNGYAVVKVPKSLVSVVPAGVYAIACGKKPAGKNVKVRFSFFKKKGAVVA